MKKINVLYLLVILVTLTSCALLEGKPEEMIVYNDCKFSIKGNIFHVEVGQDDFTRDYNLIRWQVTIVRHKNQLAMELSVHRKDADYWRVPHMYDITLYQVEVIKSQIPVNEVILNE